jgi:hypothetical protein
MAVGNLGLARAGRAAISFQHAVGMPQAGSMLDMMLAASRKISSAPSRSSSSKLVTLETL